MTALRPPRGGDADEYFLHALLARSSPPPVAGDPDDGVDDQPRPIPRAPPR